MLFGPIGHVKIILAFEKQDTPAGFGKDGYCHFAIQMSNMKVIAWICTAIGRTRAVQNGKAECDHREP